MRRAVMRTGPVPKKKENIAMRVDQLMTRPVITCSPSDTLAKAAQLMWDNDCGAIPVVGDQGRVVAMITDRDICMAAYTQGSPLHSLRVQGAMSQQLFSCHPGDKVEDAEDLMGKQQIRRLPVLDGEGRPVGLLSLADLARESGNGTSSKRDGVAGRELLGTMAAICKPRQQEIEAARLSRPLTGVAAPAGKAS
jgi:CBS domain-containing protein